MFGYVRYDLPNLFVKDVMLYKALYCGLCKSIGASCGQMARIGLTYDVTFLSALLHNMTGTDIVVERANCFEHCIRKRPIARTDALTMELGAFNTALLYFKLTDDIADRNRGRGKRLWLKGGFKRAKRRYPDLVALVENFLAAQTEAERGRTASPDAAAEPTASLMRAVSDHFLREKGTDATRGLFYALGKWVYLIDALDDYAKDVKEGNYNVFALAYGGLPREELMREKGEELGFLFDTIFYSLRENLAQVRFFFNRDLTDNVILRGIPLETARVFRGDPQTRMTVKI